MIRRGARETITAALIALGSIPAPALAATIRIDSTTPGAVYEGLVDGFPGIAPLDGAPDVGGNTLAVGLKAGVTEERGIAELPLAPLAGLGAGDITSATLTFNVDDVLSTFGPGADFDGTASDSVDLISYAADGVVLLDDFLAGDAAPFASVDTTVHGVITDASLGTSGPLAFDVDVTAELQALLMDGAASFGIVFRTDDAGSATSLDDLGVGSSGPSGVGGAALPFLTVETSSGAGPTPTPTPGGGPTPTPRPTHTPGVDPGPSSPVGVRPDGRGDQLVLYYDARSTFTTFLNLRNDADSELSILLRLYGPDLSAGFDHTLSLAAGATATIDAANLRSQGLPAQFGMALASAVDGSGAPIVTRALSGSFTVANLETNSAWGAPAAARRALTVTGEETSQPAVGTVIDGATTALRAIRPELLVLSVFYDPDTLQAAAQGGHQVIFLSFNDVLGQASAASAATTSWDVTSSKNTGEPIGSPAFDARGVAVSDLVSVGGEAVRGQAGGMLFSAQPPGAYNRLIFFTESLGTFATGYLLPVITQ